MLRKVLSVFVMGLAAFAGYVAVKPSAYSVSRSTVISAPPDAVFAHINDLRQWDAWSPWAKRDPNAKATFSGPAAGPGAVFKWAGNAEIGEGTMTIVDSKPADNVRIKLEFVKPMAGSSDVAFALKPEGAGTHVTWTLSGNQGFFERAICTLMRVDLDQMVGSDYEKGLANLKSIAEGKRT